MKVLGMFYNSERGTEAICDAGAIYLSRINCYITIVFNYKEITFYGYYFFALCFNNYNIQM